MAETKKKRRGPYRFRVVEYTSHYVVWDTKTDRQHPMSDGVDVLTTATGRSMRPGSEYFRRAWERSLNENPNETLEAYFPEQFNKEQK